ncbi:MAG: hypothetical protein G01um101456_740 [Parcubacteria group bacterium Gr01-1014_56]|nr:MAG: hypothetical protein G01um101456_740 [Parcubacteria group bacterium Gr01-1014_56]
MEQLPASITITVLLLTIFLGFITALKYAVADNFVRTRLIMTSFFFFIVATLTVAYSEFFFDTLPFTIPAGVAGVVVGYLIGVRAAQAKLAMEGAAHYMRHFAHIHLRDITQGNWWAVINFYSVVGALALINFVGLTTVIFHNLKPMSLATSAFGAFLLGSIVPYLAHLWSIKTRHTNKSSTSE